MDETEFNALAEAALARLEQSLDGCEADLDYELMPGGIIEIEFADRSKIIVNRHGAAKEIWVAARAGGFHFKYADGQWIGTRDGRELFAALSELASGQAGETVNL